MSAFTSSSRENTAFKLNNNMKSKTYDIFISYSRHDIEIVRKITNFIQERGYSVWIDLDGVECGDSFRSVIVNAIENSTIFIFFSSKYSNESRWINKEISIAGDENKFIIPIKLDATKYNPGIRFDLIDLDYIDLSNDHLFTSGKNRLLKTISNKFDSNVSPRHSEVKGKFYETSCQNKLLKRLIEESKQRYWNFYSISRDIVNFIS